jgi:hypothetical protein
MVERQLEARKPAFGGLLYVFLYLRDSLSFSYVCPFFTPPMLNLAYFV